MQRTNINRARRARLHVVPPAPGAWWDETAPRTVRVLDADPALGAGLTGHDARAAAGHAVAPLMEVPAGGCLPTCAAGAGDALGLLVLDGLLVRRVRVGNRGGAELVGPGDVIRPLDDHEGLGAPVPYETAWSVVEEARLAVLDRRFAEAAGRWPSILATILARMAGGSRSSTVRLAIAQLAGLELRLLALLWHLAERFGRVERQGVVIPFRLTHELLALLAGAQRPPVTSALSRLQRTGRIRRGDGGSWVLEGAPPAELALAAGAPPAPPGLADAEGTRIT